MSILTATHNESNTCHCVCEENMPTGEKEVHPEISDVLDTFAIMPPAKSIFIDPAPLVRDSVTQAVTEHVFPRFFWPTSWSKLSLPECRAREKLYHRPRQTYGNLLKIGKDACHALRLGRHSPGPALTMLKAACCRMPGMKVQAVGDEYLPADPLTRVKWCKQPYFCPSCLWRRLLGVGMERPGPAYELAWAIQHGLTLSAFRLRITSPDFGLAQEASRELSKRLRGTVKPDAYWRCMRPDWLAFPTVNGEAQWANTGWELRMVMAGAEAERVCNGWSWLSRQGKHVEFEVRSQRPKTLKTALDALIRVGTLKKSGVANRNLVGIWDQHVVPRWQYLEMLPSPDEAERFRMITSGGHVDPIELEPSEQNEETSIIATETLKIPESPSDTDPPVIRQSETAAASPTTAEAHPPPEQTFGEQSATYYPFTKQDAGKIKRLAEEIRCRMMQIRQKYEKRDLTPAEDQAAKWWAAGRLALKRRLTANELVLGAKQKDDNISPRVNDLADPESADYADYEIAQYMHRINDDVMRMARMFTHTQKSGLTVEEILTEEVKQYFQHDDPYFTALFLYTHACDKGLNDLASQRLCLAPLVYPLARSRRLGGGSGERRCWLSQRRGSIPRRRAVWEMVRRID